MPRFSRRKKRRLLPAPLPAMQALAVYLRFFAHVLRTFRMQLAVFWSLVFGGGLVLKIAADRHPEWHRSDLHVPGEPLPYLESCYDVFLLIFLETPVSFPQLWYLQPLFFLLPIVGLGALADSFVRLGYLIFSSKSKDPEWNRMVASTFRNHVIVLGVGRVGMSVIHGLLELREPVMAIEQKKDSLFLDEIQAWNVPVITGNGRLTSVLDSANVAKARAVVLCTDDDMTNLDAALTARERQPQIAVVLRMFDNTLADKVADAFDLPVISPAQVSAPSFIAAATGRSVLQNIQLGDREVKLMDVTVSNTSALRGLTVGEIQRAESINIIMYQSPDGVVVNPDHDVTLNVGDTILMIGDLDDVLRVQRKNGSCVDTAKALIDQLELKSPSSGRRE